MIQPVCFYCLQNKLPCPPIEKEQPDELSPAEKRCEDPAVSKLTVVYCKKEVTRTQVWSTLIQKSFNHYIKAQVTKHLSAIKDTCYV